MSRAERRRSRSNSPAATAARWSGRPEPRDARRGQRRVVRAGSSSSIELREARAERLPFADRSFDGLTATYLLRYVEDPAATLRELARVVRRGPESPTSEFFVPTAAAQTFFGARTSRRACRSWVEPSRPAGTRSAGSSARASRRSGSDTHFGSSSRSGVPQVSSTSRRGHSFRRRNRDLGRAWQVTFRDRPSTRSPPAAATTSRSSIFPIRLASLLRRDRSCPHPRLLALPPAPDPDGLLPRRRHRRTRARRAPGSTSEDADTRRGARRPEYYLARARGRNRGC